MNITLKKKVRKGADEILVFDSKKAIKKHLSTQEQIVVSKSLNKRNIFDLSVLGQKRFAIILDPKKAEENRRKGAEVIDEISSHGTILDFTEKKGVSISFIEGILLKEYTFNKFKSNSEHNIKTLEIVSFLISFKQLEELKVLVDCVFQARDWVNEPVNQLTTDKFIQEISDFKKTGITVEVYRKSKLEAMSMGGILGVNQGSHDEPALVMCEWKPKNIKNKKPIVLVGKGVLFDTGGINIKTGNFMTDMKADMGGSSTMLGTLKAVAENNLPIHLIVLTPVTENRINGKELVPGDVISMHNGKTVEVLNTDAEGRLILADALSFAKKFNPSLVIDAATLTGSAFRITGHNGAAIMGTDSKNISALIKSGEEVYERLIELPMWEEFEETLKSDIADFNNLGSVEGQAVCAGFFLKKFTDYPWIHIDIAGPAFRAVELDYIPKGGTGFGVRLLYQFFKNKFVN